MGRPFTPAPHRIFLAFSGGLIKLNRVQLGFIAYVAYDVQCFKAGAGVHQWNIAITEIGASAKAKSHETFLTVPILTERLGREY